MATIWIYNPGSTPVKISSNGHSVGGKNFATGDDSDPVLAQALLSRRVILTMEPQPPSPPGWVIAAERRTDPSDGAAKMADEAPKAPRKAPAKRKKAAPKTKPISLEQETDE